ncbi:MAG TPA: glycosyltransferase [Flavobacteriales bacterium]|nr:glycosyltransferase [Flavobacteriales bacterium]
MRIFIGTNNVANILTGIQAGFEELGHETTVLLKEKSRYYADEKFTTVYRKWDDRKFKNQFLTKVKEKIDFLRQAKKLDSYLESSVSTTDLFIFCWSSFKTDFSDYAFLKKRNKKIVTLFAGSEARYAAAFASQYNMNIDAWDHLLKNDDLNEKMYQVRMAELYSDLILSVPDQAGLMIKGYDHFYLPIELKKYPFRIEQAAKPRIIHAPTRTGAKGTDIFLQVIERLKNEGIAFDFSFIQNLSHAELINRMAEADILLDELYFHGPGMMALEAMALGCTVVTRTLKTNKNIFDPPVCDVDFNTVYEKTRDLILNRDKRLRIARAARNYIERHNDAKLVCQRILDRLNSASTDYIPEYFTNEFRLPAGVEITAQNKMLTTSLIDALGKHSAIPLLKQKNLI